MKRKLPSWCKEAKIELIRRDMSLIDLAEAIGMTREYTTSVVNGKTYSQPAVDRISEYLNISNLYL